MERSKNDFWDYLEHGQKWQDHKYLYIDKNGNYVYPEDLKKKAGDAVQAAKHKVAYGVHSVKRDATIAKNTVKNNIDNAKKDVLDDVDSRLEKKMANAYSKVQGAKADIYNNRASKLRSQNTDDYDEVQKARLEVKAKKASEKAAKATEEKVRANTGIANYDIKVQTVGKGTSMHTKATNNALKDARDAYDIAKTFSEDGTYRADTVKYLVKKANEAKEELDKIENKIEMCEELIENASNEKDKNVYMKIHAEALKNKKQMKQDIADIERLANTAKKANARAKAEK